MTDADVPKFEHLFCEGLKTGYEMKKEVKKTSVKLLQAQDFFREIGKYEEKEYIVAGWKRQLSKIGNLIRAVECKCDEAACRKLVDRIFTLLLLLRKEMNLYLEFEFE